MKGCLISSFGITEANVPMYLPLWRRNLAFLGTRFSVHCFELVWDSGLRNSNLKSRSPLTEVRVPATAKLPTLTGPIAGL